MKKLLLLPLVLFVMLIAAMVNPFGCREKKKEYKMFLRIISIENGKKTNRFHNYWNGIKLNDSTYLFVQEFPNYNRIDSTWLEFYQ